MPCGCSLVSAPNTDHTFPVIRHIIQISFQQRSSFMGTVCISKTDIDRHRHSIFQCFPQNIVHTLHQFRCPRKPFPSWISQFHDQEFTLRCDSRINTTDTSSSVSGCNCGNRSPVPRHIPTWYNLLLPDFCRFLKCRIDLILRIFRSQKISFRRISRYTLIPQCTNPCTSICISKIFFSVDISRG